MSAVLLIIGSLIVLWLYRRHRWANLINKYPGLETSHFGLLGDTMAVRQFLFTKGTDIDPTQNVLRILDGVTKVIDNDGLLRLWMGPMPHLFATDADHVEAILASNDLTTKGIHYEYLNSWLGTGLLTASGVKWRKNRKMLTPSFHFRILEQFVPVMSKNGKILVEKLEEEAAQNDGLIRDLGPFILLCALDVICETAMGAPIDAQSNREGAYVKAVHSMSDIIMDRNLKPWTFTNFVFNLTETGRKEKRTLKILHGFTDSVIKKRKEMMKNAPPADPNCNEETEEKKKEPFMDTLIREHLNDPEEFTELNIREEVDTFMFEGHDTTAWGVIWCTYLLGLNPDCQARVQEEVDLLFAEKGDEQDLTLEEMRMGLNYTEAVVKEAQRLYPSVPMFTRVAAKDTKVKDSDVPAGTFMLIIPTLVHHSDKYWPEAQKFKPERFLSRERRHPYAFVPFSAGPRNCIGQKFAMLEEKALIAKIFRKFKVTSLDHRDVIVPSASLILKSSIPIRVKLEVRHR